MDNISDHFIKIPQQELSKCADNNMNLKDKFECDEASVVSENTMCLPPTSSLHADEITSTNDYRLMALIEEDKVNLGIYHTERQECSYSELKLPLETVTTISPCGKSCAFSSDATNITAPLTNDMVDDDTSVSEKQDPVEENLFEQKRSTLHQEYCEQQSFLNQHIDSCTNLTIEERRIESVSTCNVFNSALINSQKEFLDSQGKHVECSFSREWTINYSGDDDADYENTFYEEEEEEEEDGSYIRRRVLEANNALALKPDINDELHGRQSKVTFKADLVDFEVCFDATNSSSPSSGAHLNEAEITEVLEVTSAAGEQVISPNLEECSLESDLNNKKTTKLLIEQSDSDLKMDKLFNYETTHTVTPNMNTYSYELRSDGAPKAIKSLTNCEPKRNLLQNGDNSKILTRQKPVSVRAGYLPPVKQNESVMGPSLNSTAKRSTNAILDARKKMLAEEKRKLNNEIMESWIRDKNRSEMERRRRERIAKQYEETCRKEQEEEERHKREQTFQNWLKRKENEKNWENLLKERELEEKQRVHEVRTRERCEEAFKEWLRKKNREALQKAKEAKERIRINQAIMRQCRRSRALAHALQHVDIYRLLEAAKQRH